MIVSAKQVKGSEIAEYWPKIRHLICPAIATMRGKYDEEDMFSEIALNKVQLWAGSNESGEIQVIGLTHITSYPGCKVCEVICVTGEEMQDWLHLMSYLESWAKANGCKDMQLFARAGWKKIMKPYGFEDTHVVLNKYL